MVTKGPAVREKPPDRGAEQVRTVLLAALAAAWGVLLLDGTVRQAGGLLRGIPSAFAPAFVRSGIETGSPPYWEFLDRLRTAAAGEGSVLLMVADPGMQFTYFFYRAGYELYPQKPWLIPLRGPLPPQKSFTLPVDNETLALVRDNAIRIAGYYNAAEPPGGSIFAVKAGASSLRFGSPAAPAAAPVNWRARAPWLWPLGLAFILAAGFMVNGLVGLNRSLRGDAPAILALSLVTGAGLLAWEMQMLSFAGVRLAIPAVALPWALVAVLWAWRRFFPPAAPGTPPPSAVPPVPAAPASASPPRDVMARVGVALIAFACVFALVRAAVPMSAWGNWDAWAIWGVKTRACMEARGIPFGYLHERLFEFSQREYPLGVPMAQIFLGFWTDGLGVRLMRLLHFVYYGATLVMLARFLAELGVGRARWLVAGLFALIPKIMEQASSGYTDLWLVCTMLVTAMMLARVLKGEPAEWAVGLFGGIAGGVKDEGLILAGGCLLVLAVRAGRRFDAWRRLACAALIFAALVGPWRAVVLNVGLKSRAYAIKPVTMLASIPERSPVILQALMHESVGPGLSLARLRGMGKPAGLGDCYAHARESWYLLWYALLLGIVLGFRTLLETPVRELALLLLFQGCAYLSVYLAMFLDLRWTLVTSLDRLLLQTTPLTVVVAAACLFGTGHPDRKA